MIRKTLALMCFLLCTEAFAGSFRTNDFDVHFTEAFGKNAEESALRLTSVTLTVAPDDLSRRNLFIRYDGQLLEYNPKDNLMLAVRADHGTNSLVSADISLPRTSLKEGDHFVAPQGIDGGLAEFSYKNGFLHVKRAEDPQGKNYSLLYRFQNDLRIQISPDLKVLKSISWQGYHLKPLIFGFKKKEVFSNIFARFNLAKDSSGQ